jgi:hypothetical protein
MKKTYAFHPVLFALFPIFSIYTFNMSEMTHAEKQIVIPAVASVLLALVVWSFFSLLLKNGLKAGLIASLFVFLFFSYGHVFKAMENVFSIRHRLLYLVWLIALSGGSFVIIRTKRNLGNITTILNFMAIVLLILNAINFSVNSLKTSSVDLKPGSRGRVENPVAELGAQDNRKDIYYIILDGYPNETTLKDLFNIDISDFTGFLKGKGFFIASKSRSNYSFTELSLSSSLNMEYLGGEIDKYRNKNNFDFLSTARLSMIIEDNKVKDFLKSQGYRLIHFSSGFQITDQNRYFDVVGRCSGISEFTLNTLKTTMFLPLCEYEEFGKKQRRMSCAMKEIAKIPSREKGPVFVFVHLDVSHNPWNPGSPGYPADLKALNDKLKKLVDEILSDSKSPPIIILQGDHGTGSKLMGFLRHGGKSELKTILAQGQLTDEIVRERMRIFNAYYLPDGGAVKLYDSITPVNTFRVIFDYYFNADYKLLDDMNYYSWPFGSHEFADVTDRVVF